MSVVTVRAGECMAQEPVWCMERYAAQRQVEPGGCGMAQQCVGEVFDMRVGAMLITCDVGWASSWIERWMLVRVSEA